MATTKICGLGAHYDALGNVMDLTDHLGEGVIKYRWDAFGGMFAGTLAPYSRMGITGKEYDPKTGLVFFGSRWYDPMAGRFTMPDTFMGRIAWPQTLNSYAYALNNPVKYTDPTGHDVGFGGGDGGGDSGGDSGGWDSGGWDSGGDSGGWDSGGWDSGGWDSGGYYDDWGSDESSGDGQGSGVNNYTMGAEPLIGNNNLDNIQTTLTVIGLVPGVGEFADVANAAISLARGDYGDATLNLAAAIPVLGSLAVGAKVTNTVIKEAKVVNAVEGAGKAVKAIATPYEKAVVQETSQAALKVEQQVANGNTVYRAGEFGRSGAAEGQFWAPESPFNPGYADRYGVDFSRVDFVIGGRMKEGAPFVTRATPGLGANQGGAIEIVTNPYSVVLDFFHMP